MGFRILLATLLISVMALFLCPLSYAHGGFQSTHGPTSTVNSVDQSGHVDIACAGVMLPNLVLHSTNRSESRMPAEASPDPHPLRAILCEFRC